MTEHREPIIFSTTDYTDYMDWVSSDSWRFAAAVPWQRTLAGYLCYLCNPWPTNLPTWPTRLRPYPAKPASLFRGPLRVLCVFRSELIPSLRGNTNTRSPRPVSGYLYD